MSSLIKCLGKMSKLIPSHEAEAVQGAAAEYLNEGFPAQEANERAVQDVLKELEADLGKILAQAKVPEPKAMPLPYGAIKLHLPFDASIVLPPDQWEQGITNLMTDAQVRKDFDIKVGSKTSGS
jgi:hypothetical protein